jgi:hypothetical protein
MDWEWRIVWRLIQPDGRCYFKLITDIFRTDKLFGGARETIKPLLSYADACL